MDGAADLLVEQHVPGAAVDAEVGADPELAEPARALIRVEQAHQVVLATLGACVDHLPRVEPQAGTHHLASAHHRRKVERDLTLDGVLDRGGEELAVRHVVLTVGGDELAPGDAEPDVCSRRGDMDLLVPLDPASEALPLLGCISPGVHRIVRVDEACSVIEVLELRQAHLRIGGIGRRREERVDPAEVALRASAKSRLHQLAGGRAPARLPLGRNLGELAGVRLGADDDVRVALLRLPARRRGDPVELRVRRVAEIGRGLPVERHRDDGVGARAQGLLVDRRDERLARR